MSDVWVSFPDKNTALHGLADTDDKWGYPLPGMNLATGLPDPSAQATTTWATPVERVDAKWAYSAPPEQYRSTTGYETYEPYDASWFAFPPRMESAPVISGGKIVGATALCSDGTWAPTPDPITFAYQWKKSGTAVSGATNNRYTFTAADHYGYFTCVVTAANRNGETVIETPQQWGPIGP